jgi:hypothetical protein
MGDKNEKNENREKGNKGEKGEKGEKGDIGEKGEKGDTGDSRTGEIGNVIQKSDIFRDGDETKNIQIAQATKSDFNPRNAESSSIYIYIYL